MRAVISLLHNSHSRAPTQARTHTHVCKHKYTGSYYFVRTLLVAILSLVLYTNPNQPKRSNYAKMSLAWHRKCIIWSSSMSKETHTEARICRLLSVYRRFWALDVLSAAHVLQQTATTKDFTEAEMAYKKVLYAYLSSSI